MEQTDLKKKRRKDTSKLSLLISPKPAYQTTKSEYGTKPDNFENDKLLKSYKEYYLPKGNKYKSRKDFFSKKNS